MAGAILDPPGLQPLPDEPEHARVGDPTPDAVLQLLERNGVETPLDVGVQNPVHVPFRDRHRKRVQCVVLAAFGPEPIAESEEIDLEHLVQDGHARLLDDLVFQRRDAERAQAPVLLLQVAAFDRLGPISTTVQALVQIGERRVQKRPVGGPRHPVDPWGCITRQPIEAVAEQTRRQVAEQIAEPCLSVRLCPLPHA